MAKQLWFSNVGATYKRLEQTPSLSVGNVWWAPNAMLEARGAGVSSSTVTPAAGQHSGIEPGSLTQKVEWMTEPLSADFTIAGTITANLWAYETDMNTNGAIGFTVDRVDGATGALTEIAKIARTSEVAVSTTTGSVNNFTATPTSTVCKRGDRLRIRVYFDDVGATAMAAIGSLVFRLNGATAAADGDSYIQFTENLTFEPAGDPVSYVEQPTRVLSHSFGTVGSGQRIAQAFVAQGRVNEVRAYLSKQTTPTDNVIIEIQSDAAGSPSGTVVGTVATVAASALTTSNIQYTYSGLDIPCVAGETYHLVFRRDGTLSSTLHFYAGGHNATVAGWSPFKNFNGSAWSDSAGPLTVRIGFAPCTYYLTDTNPSINPGSAQENLALTDRGSTTRTITTGTVTGPTAGKQITYESIDSLPMEWYTPPLEAVTFGGKARFNIWARESNAAANASLRAEIAIVNEDGTGAVVWGMAGMVASELGTTDAAQTAWVSGDDVAITTGQRLRFRIYVDDAGATGVALVTGHTIFVSYNGPTAAAAGDTYVILPVGVAEAVMGPPPIYGATSMAMTFGKSVAGVITGTPQYTTPIDDFNRADGLVNAGVGTDIWMDHSIGTTNPPELRVIGNQLGVTVPWGAGITDDEYGTDVDVVVDCTVTPTAGVSINVCMTNTEGSSWNGISVGSDPAGGLWWGTEYINGGGYSMGGFAGPTPQAGDTWWMCKRGTSLKLYRSVGGGPFVLIVSWACGVRTPGSISIQMQDATQRWDNLRGGPVFVPAVTHYGATSMAVTFSATTAARRTTKGAVAMPITFSKDVSAQRKTFSSIALPLTFAKAVAARKQTFGVVARPITFSATTAGNRVVITYFGSVSLSATFGATTSGQRKTFGVVARPITFGKAVAGRKQTFGAVAMPITFGATVAGIGTTPSQTYYGVVSMPITFSAVVAGRRKTFSSVAMPITFSAVTAGRRRTTSSIYLPITFGKVVAGRKQTFGVISMPITALIATAGISTVGAQTYYGVVSMPMSFGATTQGRRRTTSQISFPITFSATTAGKRTAISQIAFPITFGKAVAGRKQTFATVSMPITFFGYTAARRRTTSQIVLPISFSATTAGKKRTTGQVALAITFSGTTRAVIKTYGRIVMPINFGAVTSGINWVGAQTYFGATSMSVTFGKAVAGKKQTFASLALPVIFSATTAARRKTFGQIAVPIIFGKAVAGFRPANAIYGSVALPITFAKSVAGTKKTFGQIVLPITFSKDVVGRRKTFGQISLAEILSISVAGRRTTRSSLSLALLFNIETAAIEPGLIYGEFSLPIVVSFSTAGIVYTPTFVGGIPAGRIYDWVENGRVVVMDNGDISFGADTGEIVNGNGNKPGLVKAVTGRVS